MKAEELLRQEFIGLRMEVKASSNDANVGIKGMIIDETKSSFVVDTEKGEKRLLKNTITFEVDVKGKRYRIQGKLLQKRPQDRIKTRLK